MRRAYAARLALAALLVATGLSCNDDSNPSSPTTANLAQMATKGGPILTPQTSGTTARLIGVDAVNQNVAWVSGVGGTFAVTTDGGATWRSGVAPSLADTYRELFGRR